MDLCTVAQVQSYLGITDPTQDAGLLQQLVSSASIFAEKYTGRTFLQQSYDDVYNGSGSGRMAMRHVPVTAVSSLMVDGRSVPASASPWARGYTFDRSTLYLRFGYFYRGPQNIEVQYTAGFADGVVTGEAVNVPAEPGPYQATLLEGLNLRAITSLMYSGGGVLTQVAANPVQGQYVLTAATLTFSAADAGASLLANYTTNGTPLDISQAVVEMVAVKYQKRDRLDMRSKTIATQTIAYDMSQVPPSVLAVLEANRYFWSPT